MAETYCDRHFVDAPDVYLTLLEVYLKVACFRARFFVRV